MAKVAVMEVMGARLKELPLTLSTFVPAVLHYNVLSIWRMAGFDGSRVTTEKKTPFHSVCRKPSWEAQIVSSSRRTLYKRRGACVESMMSAAHRLRR